MGPKRTTKTSNEKRGGLMAEKVLGLRCSFAMVVMRFMVMVMVMAVMRVMRIVSNRKTCDSEGGSDVMNGSDVFASRRNLPVVGTVCNKTNHLSQDLS